MADASCAIVNGAVSLVNAIAARKGATLGVKLVYERDILPPIACISLIKFG